MSGAHPDKRKRVVGEKRKERTDGRTTTSTSRGEEEEEEEEEGGDFLHDVVVVVFDSCRPCDERVASFAGVFQQPSRGWSRRSPVGRARRRLGVDVRATEEETRRRKRRKRRNRRGQQQQQQREKNAFPIDVR